MSIFGFGKKKEEQKQSYCCGGNCTSETIQAAEAEKKELKFSVEVVPSATHWKWKPKKHCGNSAWMLPSTMCGTLKKSPPME